MLYFVTSLEELAWRGYRTFGIAELEAALKLWEQSSGQEAEEFWQSALSEHSFVLSQLFSAPAILIEEQPYVGGKEIDNTGGSRADFLVQNSLTQSVTLIEIKKPSSALLASKEYRAGVFLPSSDLAGAVSQAEMHRDTSQRSSTALQREKRSTFPMTLYASSLLPHGSV